MANDTFVFLDEVFGSPKELEECLGLAKAVIETFLEASQIVGYGASETDSVKLQKVIVLLDYFVMDDNG